MDGPHRSPVRPPCVLSPDTAQHWPPVEPARAQGHLVCRRARLHGAGLTATVRSVAHRLHPADSVGQAEGPRPSLCPPATHTEPADQTGGAGPRQPHRQGPSRWPQGGQQNGPQASGQSCSGGTTQRHRVTADARTALPCSLSPGQPLDAPLGVYGLGCSAQDAPSASTLHARTLLVLLAG